MSIGMRTTPSDQTSLSDVPSDNQVGNPESPDIRLNDAVFPLWLYVAHLTKRAHVSPLPPERSNRLTLVPNRCNKGVPSLQSWW